MQSLLGQFYNKIKGSQEDIASEGLTYILKKSVKARQSVNQIVNFNTGLIFTDLTFQTQKSGENLERPDITGIDNTGNEVLIIEAKFWASLTKNQPNTYLKNLGKDSVLIFTVPSLRIRPIYEEVLAKMKEAFTDIETDLENFRIRIKQNNKYVLIKSWTEILNVIKSELIQEDNKSLISDIDQIIGFCDTVDRNAFQPIIDIDLSPGIAKKINSYYDIVDKVVDEVKNRSNKASTKGLMRKPQKYGYRRYFAIGNYGFGMGLKMELWEEYADTPFWLSVAEGKEIWISTEGFKKKCEKVALNLNHKFVELNNEIFFSLKPKLNETEDIVINGLADQVEQILNEIDRNNG